MAVDGRSWLMLVSSIYDSISSSIQVALRFSEAFAACFRAKPACGTHVFPVQMVVFWRRSSCARGPPLGPRAWTLTRLRSKLDSHGPRVNGTNDGKVAALRKCNGMVGCFHGCRIEAKLLVFAAQAWILSSLTSLERASLKRGNVVFDLIFLAVFLRMGEVWNRRSVPATWFDLQRMSVSLIQ